MSIQKTTIALAFFVLAVGQLMTGKSLSLLSSDDGGSSQSPYSSFSEIPSDLPVNPYNNYPYSNNQYPYPNPNYYNGAPSYYNGAPGYSNGYPNQYSPDHQNYPNQQYRNYGQGAQQPREGGYGGEDRGGGRGGR